MEYHIKMLTPDQTSQLDSIVQKMAAQNAPASDVQAVVRDFKTKYDTGNQVPTTPQAPAGQSFLSSAVAPIKDFGVGLYKSSVGLGGGLSTLIGGALSKVPVVGKVFQQTGQQLLQQSVPQNFGESVGSIAGQASQLIAPGGIEEMLAKELGGFIDATKLPEAVKAITKIIGSGAITGGSMGAATTAQAGDINKGIGAAEFGAAAGVVGKALDLFGPGLSKTIQKANFKLTPTQEAKLGKQVESAASFVADNKILGSEASKYRKLTGITNQMEDTIQTSVGSDLKINKQDLINQIKQAPEAFKTQNPAVYQEAKNDAAAAIKTLEETKGDTLTAEDLLNGKRSYGQSAFGKGQAQVKGSIVRSEGDYAVEQAYYNTLNKALSDSGQEIQIPKKLQPYFGGKTSATLKDFNAVYTDAINARKFSNAAQFKKDTGLVGRLFGLWAGESIGAALAPGLGGKIVYGALGEIASSRVPGIARNVGQRLVSAGSTPVIAGAKGIQALENQPDGTNP